MYLQALLKRALADERGTNTVEYVAVTGIALLAAGLIITAIIAGRARLGGQMATILDQQIVSFESGQGGTANTPTNVRVRDVVPGQPPLGSVTMPVLSIPTILTPAPQVAHQGCEAGGGACQMPGGQTTGGVTGAGSSQSQGIWGAVLGGLGAGLLLLGLVALGVVGGVPLLVAAATVGLGALAGYLYVQATGRVDVLPILLLGAGGGVVALLGGAGLAGAALAGAALGGGLDYALQVIMNYQRGLRGADAWANNIKWSSVAASGLGGAIAGLLGFLLGPGAAALAGGGLWGVVGAGAGVGGLASIAAQIAINMAAGQPWNAGLLQAGLAGILTGGVGGLLGRLWPRFARAISDEPLAKTWQTPRTVTSLDGEQRVLRFRDMSGWAQGVAPQLDKRGWVRVRDAPIRDLAMLGQYFGREIGVLQSSVTGRIRLVLGSETGVPKAQIRPDEFFLAHTHPVFRSLPDHFALDIRNATGRVEAVVDWGETVVYFTNKGIMNPVLPVGPGLVVQPMPDFTPPFINDAGRIVGFPTGGPGSGALAKGVRIQVQP